MASKEHLAHNTHVAKQEVQTAADNLCLILGIDRGKQTWGAAPAGIDFSYGGGQNRQDPAHVNCWLWCDLAAFMKQVEQRLTEMAAAAEEAKTAEAAPSKPAKAHKGAK